MNLLLIHSENTFIKDKIAFSNNVLFSSDNRREQDIDYLIHQFIFDKIYKLENIDCIFIPFSLSENYLEFLGLRLAYHLRLTFELNEKSKCPIVLFGELTPWQVNKISNYGQILFTEGVYYVREDLEIFNKIIKRIFNKELPGLLDINNFINKVNIPNPENYSSHHSIANEWSILRWTRFLKIEEDERFKGLYDRINSSLFYKYLFAHFPIEDMARKPYNLENGGKIVYIDDEWNKGWSIILKEFFKSFSNVDFIVYEEEFNSLSRDEIINSYDKITAYDPEVVILDLRLHDSDFNDQNIINDYTGLKILKKIKEFNAGIQVIIFTASNKIWNYEQLINNGANGIIIKESPEFNRDKDFTNQNIINFCELIDSSLSNKFLKIIFIQTQLAIGKINNLRSQKN